MIEGPIPSSDGNQHFQHPTLAIALQPTGKKEKIKLN
jgi:hypothetical protein